MTAPGRAAFARLQLVLAFLCMMLAATAHAKQCATPARSGSPAGVSGIVNTYFPGTVSVAAGATSLTLGASIGAATPIAAGDLLLVIQMQGATINSNNDAGYGNGSTTDSWAHGYTAIGQTGRYEFVRATSALGIAGGTLSVSGATGAGLVYAYANATATASAGQVNAGASCSYSVDTTATTLGDKVNTIPAGGVTGLYGTTAVASATAASAILQVQPPLAASKTSTLYSDPLNDTTLPKAIPGGFVTYQIAVTNSGSYTVTSDSLAVIDATPANLRLFLGNVGPAGPVEFVDGPQTSTLAFTFTSLASATDDIDFFSTTAGWAYVPSPDANGVDANVTQIRIRPRGAMAPGSSFSVRLRYRIG